MAPLLPVVFSVSAAVVACGAQEPYEVVVLDQTDIGEKVEAMTSTEFEVTKNEGEDEEDKDEEENDVGQDEEEDDDDDILAEICPYHGHSVMVLMPRWGRMGEIGLPFFTMHPTLGEGGFSNLKSLLDVRQGFYTYEVMPSNVRGALPDVLTECFQADFNGEPLEDEFEPRQLGIKKTEVTPWQLNMRWMRGMSSNSYAVWRALRSEVKVPRVVVAIIVSDFRISGEESLYEYKEDCSTFRIPAASELGRLTKDGSQKVIIAKMKKDVKVDYFENMKEIDLDLDADPQEMFSDIRKEVAEMKQRGTTVRVDVIFEFGKHAKDDTKVMRAMWAKPYGEFAMDELWTLTYTKAFTENDALSCYHPAGVVGQNEISMDRILRLSKPSKEGKSTVAHSIGKVLYEAGTMMERTYENLYVFAAVDEPVEFGDTDEWHPSMDCEKTNLQPSRAKIEEMLGNLGAKLIVATSYKEGWSDAAKGRILVVSPEEGYQAWERIALSHFQKNGGTYTTAMIFGPGMEEQAKEYWRSHNVFELDGYLAWTYGRTSDDGIAGGSCYVPIGRRDGEPFGRSEDKLVMDVRGGPEDENPAAYVLIRSITEKANRKTSFMYFPTRKVKFADSADLWPWRTMNCEDKKLPTAKQFADALEDADSRIQIYTKDDEIRRSWEVVKSDRISFGGKPGASSKTFYVVDAGDMFQISQAFQYPYWNSINRNVVVIGKWDNDGVPSCVVGKVIGTAGKTAGRKTLSVEDRGVGMTIAQERDHYAGANDGTGREAALYRGLEGSTEAGSVLVLFVDGSPNFTKECLPMMPTVCPDFSHVCLEDIKRAAEKTAASVVLFVSDNDKAQEWVDALGGSKNFPIALRAYKHEYGNCNVDDALHEVICNWRDEKYQAKCKGDKEEDEDSEEVDIFEEDQFVFLGQ